MKHCQNVTGGNSIDATLVLNGKVKDGLCVFLLADDTETSGFHAHLKIRNPNRDYAS